MMSHEMLATILWTMLGVSIVLTILGLGLRSWPLLAIAAVLSVVFGVLAIFSIGVFVFVLTALQVVSAATLYRSHGRT
jgi:hypothetical protein